MPNQVGFRLSPFQLSPLPSMLLVYIIIAVGYLIAVSWLLSNESQTHKSSRDKTPLVGAIHMAAEISTRAVVRRNDVSIHLFVICSKIVRYHSVSILQLEKPLGDGVLLTILV